MATLRRSCPEIEELERREVLSGFSIAPFLPNSTGSPAQEEHTRFISIQDDTTRGFERLDVGAGEGRGLLPGARFDRFTLFEARSFTSRLEDGRFGSSSPQPIGPSIVIDTAWLSQRGPGPYLLDQAGATYILQTDVRTEGTAFVVAAADVTLDLNSHTVVYGDSLPLALRNGGFEEGNGRNVPGWRLDAAPAAALSPNTSHLFGQKVLRLSSFRSRQQIVSNPIPIPKAGRTYTATITPSGVDARSTVRLSVVDVTTGKVLGRGSSAQTDRGFSAVVPFIPQTTHPVRLQIDVTPPRGKADSLDLDAATLTVSADYGVLASGSWNDGVPGLVNLPPEAQAAYRNAANFTIRNGAVRQGQGNGYGSSPLFFRDLAGLTVERVETYATGTDTESLEATYASGAIRVSGSTFREEIANVSNRMHNLATLKLNNVRGPVVVEGNRILGSPQAGIVLVRNDPQSTVRIAGNEFRQNGIVTNAYAIILSGGQNFDVTGNIVAPSSGRGFLLDGFTSTELVNGTIAGNHVEVQEAANREYPRGLESVALRLRNNVGNMGTHRLLRIHHNAFIARTGLGLVEQAYGVRVSYANPHGQMTDAGIALEDNIIKAVVLTSDEVYRAKALVLDRIDAGINLRIAGNVLESNDVSLALGEAGEHVVDAGLVATTLRRSTEGVGRGYRGIVAGTSEREGRAVRLLGTRLENGATDEVTWSRERHKDVTLG